MEVSFCTGMSVIPPAAMTLVVQTTNRHRTRLFIKFLDVAEDGSWVYAKVARRLCFVPVVEFKRITDVPDFELLLSIGQRLNVSLEVGLNAYILGVE